ncbi:CoA transferase [Cupriavidus basilensis]|uniref:CoA transferase n=1 Tax=Cupriavidus basilensis TaxID=68895 RepID=UPI0039F6D53B
MGPLPQKSADPGKNIARRHNETEPLYFPDRRTGLHPAVAPNHVFEAPDGPALIGIGNDTQQRRFGLAADLQEVVDAPDFTTITACVASVSETVDLVPARVRPRPVAEWRDTLRAANVARSPIHRLDRALDHPVRHTDQITFS